MATKTECKLSVINAKKSPADFLTLGLSASFCAVFGVVFLTYRGAAISIAGWMAMVFVEKLPHLYTQKHTQKQQKMLKIS